MSFWPANEGGREDVPVAHGGHGDDHAVDALEVGQLLPVLEQRGVSVVLNQVDKTWIVFVGKGQYKNTAIGYWHS